MSRAMARFALLAIVLVVSGCVTRSVIRTPPAVSGGVPATVPNAVVVTLDWSNVQNRIGDPSVSLDGNNVTAAFGQNIQCCTSANATFTLAPGSHTLQVSVPRSATLGTYVEILPFTVVDPSFTIALSPATVALTPGATASTVATITPTFGFTGAVTLAVTGLPTGVTSTISSQSPTTQDITLSAGSSVAGGSTTATVTGTAPCAPSCGGPATSTATATLGVTVTAPGFSIASLSPANVLVPRGGTASVTVNVQRVGGFSGAINATVTNLPAGVTAGALQIAGGTSTGTLTLTATNTAGLANVAAGTPSGAQQASVNLAGVCTMACPGMTDAENLQVRIGRRVGVFAVAAPSLKNAPANATSADAAVALTYTVANPQPPGVTQFTATYVRVGSPGSLFSSNVVQSPIDWGAGFCPANPTVAGVVLSMSFGGATNAPLFYTLPIWAPGQTSGTARSVFLPVYAINSNANTTIAPMLWYSPDCTLAAFVHSSSTQTPPAALTIIDMTTGQPIGGELQYSGPSPSRIEVATATAGQEVRVQFSPTDQRKLAIP